MPVRRAMCYGVIYLFTVPKAVPDMLGAFFHDSSSVLGNPDWRMMDCSVPVRNSAWFGTGTVMVVSWSFLHHDMTATLTGFNEAMSHKNCADLFA